jgi:hypothetical protein
MCPCTTIQAALTSLPTLGQVQVTTTSARTATNFVAAVTNGNALVTATAGGALSAAFAVGDWIRVGDQMLGPVYTVLSIDTGANTLLLSGPYSGVTAASVPLWSQARDAYQYVVAFDSNLGDLPALSVSAQGTLFENNVTSSAYLTACDQYATQLLTTTGSGTINGTFALYMGTQGTGDLAHDISAPLLAAALEASFPSVYAVDVVRAGPSAVGGYTWSISFLATDQGASALWADDHLLRGAGAAATVNTGWCPVTAQPTAGAAGTSSVYGVVGQTFLATLSGGLPDDAPAAKVLGPLSSPARHVFDRINLCVTAPQATVQYQGSGQYLATYTSPRLGAYNLSVALATQGGLSGDYFNNRWLFGAPSETRVDPVLDFQWGADDLITQVRTLATTIPCTHAYLPHGD